MNKNNFELVWNFLVWIFETPVKASITTALMTFLITFLGFKNTEICECDDFCKFEKELDENLEKIYSLQLEEVRKFRGIQNATPRYANTVYAIAQILDIKFDKLPRIKNECKNDKDCITKKLHEKRHYIENELFNKLIYNLQ